MRIISVGRISPIKGYETLIDAICLLKERDIQAEARIIGRPVMSPDFPYDIRLRRMVRDRNLTPNIEFVGFVPYRDIAGHYQWADIAVGMTPPGGIDKSLLEAMACGCVVVTSNTVMSHDVKTAGVGLLYSFGSSRELADVLEVLAGTNGAGMEEVSARLRATVRHRHPIRTAVERISALLDA